MKNTGLSQPRRNVNGKVLWRKKEKQRFFFFGFYKNGGIIVLF